MAHQVLARKWRPQSFDQLVGQAHVLQALGNALDQGRLHHAYLFSGTRGVGKTTIARILARCFNCEQGVSAKPCGECSSCQQITEGRSIDLIEVDAASRTKVDDTRELLDNVQFAPTQARYKIYLIDEVHMLSNSSFNALLKTLEEPPPHVVFLFATTHPQKIPPTVLSRCLQFHLKNMPVETIVEHVQSVLAEESIDAERNALFGIARAAAGSMRDALSLTEQAIAFGGGSVNEEQVNEMLGIVDHQVLLDLFTAIISDEGGVALNIIKQYTAQAVDFSQLVDELLNLLHRIAVQQVVPGSSNQGQPQNQSIVEYARTVSPEDIQLYYQTALSAKNDLVLAPDPLVGLEMMVLRLLAFRRMVSGSEVSHDQAVLLESGAIETEVKKSEVSPGKKHGNGSVKSAPLIDEEILDEKYEKNTGLAQSVSTAKTNANNHFKDKQSDKPKAKSVSANSLNENIDESSDHHLKELNASSWCEIFSVLPLTGVVRAVAAHCVPLNIDVKKSSVEFGLLKADAVLYKSEYAERLAAGLAIYFGHTIAVTVTSIESWRDVSLDEKVETPSKYQSRKLAEKHQSAVDAVQNDENVQALLQAFDGQLDVDSVEPLESEHNM